MKTTKTYFAIHSQYDGDFTGERFDTESEAFEEAERMCEEDGCEDELFKVVKVLGTVEIEEYVHAKPKIKLSVKKFR